MLGMLRIVNGDGLVAVGETETDAMKGKAVRGWVMMKIVESLRGGIPAVMLGSVGLNHVSLPLDGTGNANRVDECMLEGPADGLADTPAGVGGAEMDGVFTGEGFVMVGSEEKGTKGNGD